jgi:hypothetical protein
VGSVYIFSWSILCVCEKIVVLCNTAALHDRIPVRKGISDNATILNDFGWIYYAGLAFWIFLAEALEMWP